LGEEFQLVGEAQLAVSESLPHSGHELATKDLAEYRFGQEVVFLGRHPAGVIGREAAGGNDDMDMRMELQFLVPAVQHAEKSDLRAEVPRIASHFEKGFRSGTKQDVVEDFFVVQHHRG
jgi:hypothetical protein